MLQSQSILQLIINSIRRVRDSFLSFFYYVHDWYITNRYSLSSYNRNGNQLQAEIALIVHSIEKGMSINNSKRPFGGEKALKLSKLLLSTQSSDNKDIFEKGLQLLIKYSLLSNNELSVELTENINMLSMANHIVSDDISGTKTHTIDFNSAFFNFDDYYNFTKSRVSIRNFSETEVSNEALYNAIKIAQTAPSACNRQTSKVYIYSGDIKNKILFNQLGDQGWGNNANKLIIVTSDRSAFNSLYERHQLFIDGGMFCMQLLMGFHCQKIAACCKMYIQNPKIDFEFRELTHIPIHESPIMLILIGNYQSNVSTVPFSKRLPTESIVKIL